MVKDDNGKFVPDISVTNPNLILYAPVNSCDISENQVGENSEIFKYKLPSQPSFPEPQPAVTNNLVDLTTDTDFAQFVAPTSPADF
jgi:hypothetical protein